METVISVNNLTKTFDDVTVVQNLSFEINHGDVFAFLGANGSGKTTTVRCLLNILQPTHGTTQIFGKAFDLSLASRIGYLPEERGLYANSRVLETLIYFARLKGMSDKNAQIKATNYLKRVNLASHHNTEIKKLSSGQQQKIQLGITIINTPDLLILDEPTKGLDPINRSLLMELLGELNNNGTTIIFVSHHMEEVEKIASRLVMIKDGKRALYGSLKKVKEQFGTNSIRITYEGIMPKNDTLYNITTIDKNVAEITPRNTISTNDVINYLLHHISISDFTVGTPSLHDIFLTVMKNNTY